MGIRLHICGFQSVLPRCKQSQETSLEWERDKEKKKTTCKSRFAGLQGVCGVDGGGEQSGLGRWDLSLDCLAERCKTQEVLNSALALGLDLVAEGAGYEQECGQVSEYTQRSAYSFLILVDLGSECALLALPPLGQLCWLN